MRCRVYTATILQYLARHFNLTVLPYQRAERQLESAAYNRERLSGSKLRRAASTVYQMWCRAPSESSCDRQLRVSYKLALSNGGQVSPTLMSPRPTATLILRLQTQIEGSSGVERQQSTTLHYFRALGESSRAQAASAKANIRAACCV